MMMTATYFLFSKLDSKKKDQTKIQKLLDKLRTAFFLLLLFQKDFNQPRPCPEILQK